MLGITMITSEIEGKGTAYPLMVVALMTTLFAMNSLIIIFLHLACIWSLVLDVVNFSLSKEHCIQRALRLFGCAVKALQVGEILGWVRRVPLGRFAAWGT